MHHRITNRAVVLFLIFTLIAPASQMMILSFTGTARADPPIGFNMSQGKNMFSSYPPEEPILIWDNDGNDAPDGTNGTEYFINQSLSALGYTNVTLSAQGEDLANYDLSNYTVVFALFGMAAGTGNLTLPQETQLTDFLNAGGRLYVEGGDVGFQAADGAGSGEFSNLWPYLKANYISNGGSYGNLNGMKSYLSDGMNFDYTGDNSSMDVISPSAGGFGMFNNTTNTLAVGHNGTYRTILFSFQFGGLKNSNTSTRDVLMNRMMHFFSFIKVVDISILRENIHTPMSFEGDSDDYWTHGGQLDDWQRGKPTFGPNSANTGDNVWATNLAGNYRLNADFSLYPPKVNIEANSTLTFWHWYNIGLFQDMASVEIYNNDQARWVTLAAYRGQINDWREVTISLGTYSGLTSLRFRFISDRQVVTAGWYIDDVSIWSGNESVPLSSDGLHRHGDGYFVANGIEVEPNATLKNTGNVPASFDFRARVYYQSNNTELYNETILVNLTPGEIRNTGFPMVWNTSGYTDTDFVMEFRSFALEENGTGGDNMISFGIYAGNFTDLFTEGIGIDSDEPVLPGTNINPTGNFINLGNMNLSNFTAILKIKNALTQVVYWENVSGLSLNLPHGNNTTVSFPPWVVPQGDGDYSFKLTHNLTDNNDTNDNLKRSVRAEEYYDISVDSFDFNVTQPLNSSGIVTLRVKLTNWGNMNATNFPLRCVVLNRSGVEFFNQTNNSVTVDLPMGNTSTIEFKNMNLPPEEGNITVIIKVLWGNDENASNNNLTGEASIDDHHDIGLVSPTSVTMQGDQWYDHYKRGNHQTSVNVTNYGNVNQTSVVDFKYGIEMNPLYLFEDDVESPKSYFNFDLGGVPAEFHIVEPNSPHSDFHSPTHSWWFGDEVTGNYGNNLVNVLVTKIDLRNETMAWLNFWHKYSFAVNDWSCVVYNTDSVDNPQNPFAQYLIFGDQITGNSGGWVNAMYDLSPLCGQEILIGFAGVTDAAGVSTGWYVDDVYLSIPNYTVIETHRVVGQELEPGDSEILTDNYNFAENATYYLVPETALDGDENSGNNPGLLRVQVKDFPDLAPVDIGLTNARPTYFMDDFENDDGGLVPTGPNSFAWGIPAVPGGPVLEEPNTKCWAVDLDSEYRNDLDIFLTGRLDIKNFTGAMLSFDHWYNIENLNDGLWVEIRNASDRDFRNVTPLGGYPKTVPGKPGWPNGAVRFPCFNDHSGGGEESIWETVRFNISEYAGNVVYIRFRFISDNAIIRPGWFMDNLTVSDPIIEARYRVNRNVNCVIDFDISNLGNIPSVGGTGQLTIKGITDDTYSYTDSLSLSNVAAGGSSTKTFSTPWTSPNVLGLYLATISLDSPDDFMPTNSNMSIIIEVQDSHNIMARGIANPLPDRAYVMGDTISLAGLVRNVGTHDETGITVNATIIDVEDESWNEVKFQTTIDLKLKETRVVEFEWTIPSRLGARYRVTYEVGHNIDGNSTDNTYSVDFYALPEKMDSAAFGFVFDNSSDSPFYGDRLDNVTVQLKVKGSFNAIATEKTDENGYFSMNLTTFTRGLDYTLQFIQDWYLHGKYDFYMKSDTVYKCNIGMLVDNLNPRAVLALPIEEPYYVLAGDNVTFSFADTSDADTPAQLLTYRLESDIAGLMYQGNNVSFISSLEPGTHILTLTVMDEMGGEDNTSVEVISYASSWKTLTSDDGALSVELLSAGPGAIEIIDETTIGIPEELLDIGYGYNFQTKGVIFVLETRITLNYNESDLHHNAREQDLRFYKYDHEYPGTSWELVIPFVIDEENDTLSITLTGKNRSLDIDLVPLAVTDTISPYVIETVPADGASGVSVFSDINITFSENILISQLKKEGIFLEEGPNALDFDMEYNDTTYTLTLVPRQEKLAVETDYSIEITGVYDLVYNAMDDFAFSFRTGDLVKTKEQVSGFVRDLEYEAIQGAKIIVKGEVRGVSDENGFYSIYLAHGDHTVTVNKTGYMDISVNIEVKMDIPVTKTFFMKKYVFLDLVLITGHIKDDSTNPMSDVIIKLDGKVRGYTDMMGYFEIEITRGIYDLTASSDGFAPYSRVINLINGSIDLNITLRKMDFAIVRGNVKDRSGMGIAGVKVEIRKQNRVVEENITDADGNYYVEIPGGSYIIVFTKDGYETGTSNSLRVEDGEEKVVPDQILLKKEKTVSQSAASKYWPWAVLIFVIGLVVIILFVVVRRPVGKAEDEEVEEPMGATGDAEEAETPGPEVVSVDIGPPGAPPGPPGIGEAAVPVPVGDDAEAAQLPQMEDRPALTEGATEMLALPAGPEGPAGGEGVAEAEMDNMSETVEPAGETEMEGEIADTGEPEAAVEEPETLGESVETPEAAVEEPETFGESVETPEAAVQEPVMETATEQPVIAAAIPEVAAAEPVTPAVTPDAVPTQPVSPATVPEPAPVQPAATVPVPSAVPTPETQVPPATDKPKRRVVRRRVVKKPVAK